MPGENPEVILTSPITDVDHVLSSIGDSIIVDRSVVCGRAHALSAYERALRNIRRGTAKGSSLATEFFRQISGERQVSQAIRKARIREGSPAVIITCEGHAQVLERLGLSESEGSLDCVGDNCEKECMERSALVEIL